MEKRRLIVGISGASGIVYGTRLLEILGELDIETHLVMSKAAEQTRASEINMTSQQLKSLADVVHNIRDIGATLASGSYKTMGMIVAPCSMKTLAEIATGVASSLLTRAADVVLKERRRLVLMARECPLHLGHLENMLKVTQLGGIIYPPTPAFYANPQSIDDMVTYSVVRALDLFDIDVNNIQINRWKGMHLKLAEV